MKKIKSIILLITFALLFTSCKTTYFQVYKTTATNDLTKTNNHLVYEDENCKVSYNLWNDGGDIGFLFHNKSNKEIYLNLEESFFILNGVAHDYYQDRVFTKSSSSEASSSRTTTASKSVSGINYFNLLQTNSLHANSSVGLVSTSGYSTAYTEESIINIPAMTSKIISEYSINRALFRDCDLFKYPTKSQVKTKSFAKADSPIVFSNRLAYSVGKDGELIRFENEFYVTEITNYPENEILESKKAEFCGQKSGVISRYFKNVSPDKFYIKYIKGQDKWKH